MVEPPDPHDPDHPNMVCVEWDADGGRWEAWVPVGAFNPPDRPHLNDRGTIVEWRAGVGPLVLLAPRGTSEDLANIKAIAAAMHDWQTP